MYKNIQATMHKEQSNGAVVLHVLVPSGLADVDFDRLVVGDERYHQRHHY